MTTSEAQVAVESNTFGLIVCESRQARVWTKAELARRAEMTQSEVNRLESGKRMPTLRHVQCLAKAFSEAPRGDEPASYEGWLAVLVDVGETCRQDLRAAQRSSGD
jgi:transcriptional regulator with XRE-family HTH domain